MGEDRSRGKAAGRALIEALRRWAFSLRRDAHAVWLAARDPRTPLAAKLLGLAVAAYALSPIDLIPDFIPVLGYLDDLILVPLGLWLAIRMIPEPVMDDHRAAAEAAARRPVSKVAAAVVILIWLAFAVVGGMLLARQARLG